MKNLIILLTLLFLTTTVTAHSGRTDSSGCHNDRKNGTRHCH